MIKKLLFCFVLFFSLATMQAFAQSRTVTGKVTDENGDAMPGITVLVKGTTIGTSTAADGTYSLSIPNPDASTILVFRGLGMSKEITLGAQTTVDTQLSDSKLLGEVVVTGVGISREKRALGYSAQEVKGDNLVKQNQMNVLNSMSGQVAGVQINNSSGAPGSSAAIRIRGNASIDGNNAPLFVIDGIPIDNSQSASGNPNDGSNQFLDGVANSNRAIDINPNDIESMTILKGGAATAIYGIRAANGAVIITTKRGSATGGKPSVTFSTSWSMDEITKMPGQQKLYAQGSGGIYSGPGINQRDRHSWGPLVSSLKFDGATDNPWDKNGNLSTTNTGAAAKVYDNVGDFFQRGLTADNNVSVSMGTKKSQYYISVGNRRQKGVIPNSLFQRTSIRLNATTELSKKVKVTGIANYINSGGNRMQQGSNLSGVMLGLMRTPVTFDNSNGFGKNAVNNPEAYFLTMNGVLTGTQRGYRGASNFGTRTLQAIYDNPFFTVSENSVKDKVNRFIGSTQLEYQALPWLNIKYRIGADWYSDRKKTIMVPGSLNLGNGEGFIAEDQIFNKDITSDLIVSINRKLSEDLNLSVIFGHNYYNTQYQRFYTQGIDLSIVGFNHLSNTVTQSSVIINNRKQTFGTYADISLGYKGYLFLNLTGRNEWSSTLPEANNSFFYPAVSLGFVFSDAFDLTSDIFSFGKLRAGYSILGNDAPVYLTRTTYTSPSIGDGWTSGVNFPFQGASASTRSVVLGNSNLKPEKLTSLEVGLEASFFKNRLKLDVTYYNNLSVDQIIQVPIAESSGFRLAAMNAGEISNKGIELALTGTAIKSGDFSWDISANFTRNVNEVIKLAPGVDVITLVGFSSTSSRAIVGKGYGAIYGQGWQRNNTGQLLLDANGYPQLDPNAKFLGDPNPDWMLGITNTFNYKGISFSFLWDVKQGGRMWNGTKGALVTMGTSIATENRGATHTFPGVMPDGSAAIPVTLDEGWYRGTGGGFSGNAEDFVEETSWVRLRNVSLSYTFPKSLLGKSPFQNLSLTFSGNNLLLFTPYTGVDPETSLVGSGNGTGAMDYFNMPGIRTYSVALRANF